MAAPVPNNFNLFFTIGEATVGEIYTETDATLPDIWKEFATEIPSVTLQHTDAWTGMLPKAREWIGSRVVHEMAPQTYSVLSRPWEHTVGVDRFTFDADHIGVFVRGVQDQARQARRHPNYWIRDLVEASGNFAGGGTSPFLNPQLGFDGLTFFNTGHLQNIYSPSSSSYSNDFVGGPINVAGGAPGGSGANVAVGGQFSPSSFMTLASYMMQFKGEDGEVLGVMANECMLPASLYGEGNLVLVEASFAPPQWASIGAGSGPLGAQVGAADNPIRRYGVSPLFNRYLNNGNRWYLMDTTRSRKPLGWVMHKSPQFTMLVSEQTETVFMNHRYLWGVWGHSVPAWSSFPWLMVRSGS